jgi:hypothetical protein
LENLEKKAKFVVKSRQKIRTFPTTKGRHLHDNEEAFPVREESGGGGWWCF